MHRLSVCILSLILVLLISCTTVSDFNPEIAPEVVAEVVIEPEDVIAESSEIEEEFVEIESDSLKDEGNEGTSTEISDIEAEYSKEVDILGYIVAISYCDKKLIFDYPDIFSDDDYPQLYGPAIDAVSSTGLEFSRDVSDGIFRNNHYVLGITGENNLEKATFDSIVSEFEQLFRKRIEGTSDYETVEVSNDDYFEYEFTEVVIEAEPIEDTVDGDYVFTEEQVPVIENVEVLVGINSYGEVFVKDPSLLIGDLIIPEEINGFTVTGVGDSGFFGCYGLHSVTLPDTVEMIGDYAFEECTSLVSVTIPDSVTSIGEGSFYKCKKLSSISLPSNIIEIPAFIFSDCDSLIEIILPEGITSIGAHAFSSSGLKNISMGDNITTIGAYAFAFCSALETIHLSESLVIIEDNAFSYCDGLVCLTLPDNVLKIGMYSFWDCYNLSSIKLSTTLSEIGAQAFGSCSSLSDVILPASLQTIGDSAFKTGSKMNSITYQGTREQWLLLQGHYNHFFDPSVKIVRCSDGNYRL